MKIFGIRKTFRNCKYFQKIFRQYFEREINNTLREGDNTLGEREIYNTLRDRDNILIEREIQYLQSERQHIDRSRDIERERQYLERYQVRETIPWERENTLSPWISKSGREQHVKIEKEKAKVILSSFFFLRLRHEGVWEGIISFRVFRFYLWHTYDMHMQFRNFGKSLAYFENRFGKLIRNFQK